MGVHNAYENRERLGGLAVLLFQIRKEMQENNC